MKTKYYLIPLLLVLSLLWGCSPNQPEPSAEAEMSNSDQKESDMVEKPLAADVVSVEVTGAPNGYQFQVGISSPDTGCEQYADWWEVIAEDGQLIYRRILLHSHVDEQPFVRSGGPVEIGEDTIVIVRAHMNPGGYGGKAMQGSPASGFTEVALSPDFAADVESQPPLPDGCDF
jgi:hypothetical protein